MYIVEPFFQTARQWFTKFVRVQWPKRARDLALISKYRISRANHKPLGKKSSPPSIPIYHAFQTISSPFSFSRIFVNSILDIDNRILENLTSFLLVGSEIGSTIVSKWNRFEKYFKVFMVGGQSSIPGHGNNFPRNDCVMKAFNTGVTSSPLEIRTVTLRDIWKQCNFGGLRSTAELMRKLEHNSCSSRGISAIDGRPPKLLPRISSLTALAYTPFFVPVACRWLLSKQFRAETNASSSSSSSRLHPSPFVGRINDSPTADQFPRVVGDAIISFPRPI